MTFWYRKKKGLSQKKCSGGDWNYGDLLAAGVFLLGSEQQAAFESALAEVTKGYYEIEENESSRCQRNLQQKRIKKVQTKKQINFS